MGFVRSVEFSYFASDIPMGMSTIKDDVAERNRRQEVCVGGWVESLLGGPLIGPNTRPDFSANESTNT